MKKKKHHYVPQFYLRGFSVDNKNIHAYIKQREECQVQQIRNICKCNNFYTLAKQNDPLSLEDFFSDIEHECKIVFDAFKMLQKDYKICNMESYTISDDHKSKMAHYIILQHYRTPRYRKEKIKHDELSIKREIEILLSGTNMSIELGLTKDEPDIHSSVILDIDSITERVDDVISANWTIIFTHEEFYTSDMPTIIVPMRNMPVAYLDSLEFFSEIYFPLSPNMVLKIYHHNEVYTKSDISIEIATDEDLIRINRLIYKNANEYVFSKNNFFNQNEEQIKSTYE